MKRLRSVRRLAGVAVALLGVALTLQGSPAHADDRCDDSCTIWNRASAPSGAALYNEVEPVSLGLEFHSDIAGTVSAIRFYQNPTVTPISHSAHIWSATGALLGSVTIPAGTGGWRQAQLPRRVWIAAGASYWVSYYASDGLYDASINVAYPAGNAPLHAVAAAFHNYAPDVFPDSPSLNNANYWIDVVFHPADD